MPKRAKTNASIVEFFAQPFPRAWESWLWENMAHYRLLGGMERKRLKECARVIMAEKSWEGCDGLDVTEWMKLTVSAQAALLLLGLEHDGFSRVLSIVLFPTVFELPPQALLGRGRVMAGVAVNQGTVFLSWDTTLTEARDPSAGHNLVIHEFTHQLDFLDGYTNGAPPLQNYQQTQRWKRVMRDAFNRLQRDLRKEERTFLGSYAATNPAEFFSVASEKFYCLPGQLRQNHPELFQVLAEYYQVDPLRWFEVETKPNSDSSPTVLSSTEDAGAQEVQGMPEVKILGFEFIDFKCPYCHNPVSFPKANIGTLQPCPNCLESTIVPQRAGESAQRLPFPIRTERLLIRRLQRLDAKEVAELTSNPESLRYLDWTPLSLEQAEEWIAGQSAIGFPHRDHCGYLSIETLEPARLIGLAAIWFPHRDFDLVEFELVIHGDCQRKGYGTEAIRGILTYVFSGLRIRRIVAKCDARNLTARRLLLKAGLRQEIECLQDRLVKREWVDTIGFALLKQEYEKQWTGQK